jgi:hypothetical protein
MSRKTLQVCLNDQNKEIAVGFHQKSFKKCEKKCVLTAIYLFYIETNMSKKKIQVS